MINIFVIEDEDSPPNEPLPQVAAVAIEAPVVKKHSDPLWGSW